MKRYIRFDDYPVMENLKPAEYKDWLFYALRLCAKCRIRFILGVVPDAVTDEQAKALCEVLCERTTGAVVMHGFTHAYQSPAMLARKQRAGDWPEQYNEMLSCGGEFAGMSVEGCVASYARCHQKMAGLFGTHYNAEHFIAPFNRYTENLVIALDAGEQVRCIHTNDEVNYGFNHLGIERVMSHYKFGYDYAANVFGVLSQIRTAGEQITLHWFYDCTKRPHWRDEYDRLLRGLEKDSEYVVSA